MIRSLPVLFVILYCALFALAPNTLSTLQVLSWANYVITAGLLFVYLAKANARLDSVVVFYTSFVICIVIGSILFSYAPEFLLHFILTGSGLKLALDNYLFYMSLGLLVFILTAVSLRVTEKFSPPKKSRIAQKTQPVIKILFFFLVILCILGLILEPGYFSNVEYAISGLITGGDIRKSVTLSDSSSSFLGKNIVTAIKYQVLPFISLAMIANYKDHKYSVLAIVLISSILMMSDFRRGPLLFFIVSVIFYLDFTRKKNREIGIFRRYILPVLIVLVAFAGMTFVLGRGPGVSLGSFSPSVFFFELAYRVFITQAQTGTYVFQMIPTIMPELNGYGYLQNLPSIVTGMDSLSSADDLFYYIHGRQGGASFSSFTEGYANFGVYGLVLVAIFLPISFSFLEMHKNKRSHDNLELAFYIFCLMNLVPALAMGSAVGPFINVILLRITIFLIRSFSLILSRANETPRSTMVKEN